MKRYCITLLATSCGLVLLLGLLFALAAGQVGHRYYWVETLLARKAAAARSVDGRKILLVGGSGALFGLDAALLAKETGIPAVNMGIHGGLGADFILHEALEALRPGDLAVLALEYNLFADDTWAFSKMAVAASLSRGLGYFGSLPWEGRLEYLRYVTLGNLLEQDLGRFVTWTQRARDTYLVRDVDPLGSQTGATPDDASRASLRASMGRQELVVRMNPQCRAARAVRDFVTRCRARGVTVLATWPNTYAHPELEGADFARFVRDFRAFYAALDVPVLGEPQEAALPFDLMYDTLYHPSAAGQRLRTARLAPHLAEALKNLPSGG